MATSGQRSWTLNVDEILTEAFERVGGEPVLGEELVAARRALNIVTTELINEGVNLFTLQEALVTVSVSQAQYELPSSCVDVMSVAYRSNNLDLSMERIAFSDYLQIANKTMTGRPFQYMVDRRINGPVLYLWPLPTTSADTLYMWRVRRIEDITRSNQDIGLPFRFMPCLAAGLAYHVALKRPNYDPQRLAVLKAEYQAQTELAQGEDRDRAAVSFVPQLRSF